MSAMVTRNRQAMQGNLPINGLRNDMPEPQGDPQMFGRIFAEPARFEQMPGGPSHSMHTPRGMTPVATPPAQSPFGTP
eukprot:8363531-Pyramimonas_sp.AAC.1